MSDDAPITQWIEELRGAESAAAEKLWAHFFTRLQTSARRMLNARSRPVYDEDDAALSAFHSLFAGFANGRFPDLADRESLWRLLLVITTRKVAHRHRHDNQLRRDVRRTLSDSVFVTNPNDSVPGGIQQLPSREPTPEFVAAFTETCELLFDRLDDGKLKDIASLRLEGYTDREIAERLHCSRSTVQRRLEMIRRCWNNQNAADQNAS